MAYRWSLEGPAFEFPTPYGTENRFLVWRGYALIALAVSVVAVVSFVGADAEAGPASAVQLLRDAPEPASVVPHLVGAMLLLLLGALDLLQAAARRTLLLGPGQPASMTAEVPREGAGAGPGAAALQKLLEVGRLDPPEPVGPYEAALRSMGPALAGAPVALHHYLRHRCAHLALAAALLLPLLLAVLLVPKAAALALVSLVLMAVAGGVLAQHLLRPHRDALPPWAVAALVGGAVAVAAALAWGVDGVPRSASLPKLGLHWAAALLLLAVLLLEGVGLLAARAQLQLPWIAAVPPAEVTVAVDAEPAQLLREVDLELHRQWAEGVPNRRYAWLPPQSDGTGAGFEFRATVLEESQPLVPHTGREVAPAQAQSAERRTGLLWLDGLGLAFSLAGGLLWLWLAWAHMRDVNASWLPGATGLACLLAGAYAVRVGHLLWSRVEVQSTFTWLDFQGRCLRAAEAADTAPARASGPARLDPLTLRARVGLAQTVFYAAAPHGPGSRSLLSLAPHGPASAAWVQVLQGWPHQAAPRARVRPAEPEPPVPRPGRHCPHCGTAVQADARFCHHCGALLKPQ